MPRRKTRSEVSLAKKFSTRIVVSLLLLVAVTRSKRLTRFVARSILGLSGQKTVLSPKELADLAAAASGGGSWFSLKGLLTVTVLGGLIYAAYRFVYLEYQSTGKLPFLELPVQAQVGVAKVSDGLQEELEQLQERNAKAKAQLLKAKQDYKALEQNAQEQRQTVAELNYQIAQFQEAAKRGNLGLKDYQGQIVKLNAHLRQAAKRIQQQNEANLKLQKARDDTRAKYARAKSLQQQLEIRLQNKTSSEEAKSLRAQLTNSNNYAERLVQALNRQKANFENNIKVYDELVKEKQLGDARILVLSKRVEEQERKLKETTQALEDAESDALDGTERAEEAEAKVEEHQEARLLAEGEARRQREAAQEASLIASLWGRLFRSSEPLPQQDGSRSVSMTSSVSSSVSSSLSGSPSNPENDSP